MIDEKSTAKKPKHGGARKGSGRKPLQPTEIHRAEVAAWSGVGVPVDDIAALAMDKGISKQALYKYFSEELKRGKASANAAIGQRLFKKAMDGDTASLIFWAKSQMGMSEKQRLDVTSSDGSMTPKAFDPSKMSTAWLQELLEKANDSDDNSD